MLNRIKKLSAKQRMIGSIKFSIWQQPHFKQKRIFPDESKEAHMNFKKTILYLLLSIFILILIYNYVLPLLTTGYTTGMGMHRNYYYYNPVYYYGNIIGFIIFALIIVLLIMTLIKLFATTGPKKCNKCGYPIESNEWLICPRCGNTLNDRSVNKWLSYFW